MTVGAVFVARHENVSAPRIRTRSDAAAVVRAVDVTSGGYSVARVADRRARLPGRSRAPMEDGR